MNKFTQNRKWRSMENLGQINQGKKNQRTFSSSSVVFRKISLMIPFSSVYFSPILDLSCILFAYPVHFFDILACKIAGLFYISDLLNFCLVVLFTGYDVQIVYEKDVLLRTAIIIHLTSVLTICI